MTNDHITSELAAFAAALPTVELPELYHVGTLNPSDKGQHGASLEGDGLSISRHPHDWIRIARLGGQPTWTLTKPGNRFVAYWSLTPDMHDTIAAWSTASGYTRRAPLWTLTYNNDGSELAMTFTSEAEAYEEAEQNDGAEVTAGTGLVATAQLEARMGQRCTVGNVEDLALVAFIGDLAAHPAANLTGIDGIWWEDHYDPAELSCPRGVIVPARIVTFQRSGT